MEKTVDVLVIGGGPGGSTAAALLAKNGLNVLLLERLACTLRNTAPWSLPPPSSAWPKAKCVRRKPGLFSSTYIAAPTRGCSCLYPACTNDIKAPMIISGMRKSWYTKKSDGKSPCATSPPSSQA
ncbi:MAG TPA: FAD-dependent monooxygenase [Candidatus Angelobacter sp.]|nr:FAD-dependent monooxygenase [Candidatus Angelobacter sp.]